MSGTEQGNSIVKNILILEDEPAALRYLVKIVEDCSPLEYCVFGYTGLKEAYECMKHRTISLFMVDIMLDQKKCNRKPVVTGIPIHFGYFSRIEIKS